MGPTTMDEESILGDHHSGLDDTVSSDNLKSTVRSPFLPMLPFLLINPPNAQQSSSPVGVKSKSRAITPTSVEDYELDNVTSIR